MSNELKQFGNLWRNARNTQQGQSTDPGAIIAIARQKMRDTIKLQWGTVVILIITMMAISAFFIYVAKFRETLSHVGTGLMVGGLAVRIIVELFSIYLSKTVDPTDLTLKTSYASLRYYRFRMVINGPITIVILVLYTIGFYMLSPEFSSYFSTTALIAIDLSYILGALIVGWSIRNTIKREMTTLRDVLRIYEDIIRVE